MSESFLGYVGPGEVHDAVIEHVERAGDVLQVRTRSEVGPSIDAEFRGVTQVIEKDAKGMLLYAIAEMRSDGPQRRFSFANSRDPGEEDVERQLEVLADDVHFGAVRSP